MVYIGATRHCGRCRWRWCAARIPVIGEDLDDIVGVAYPAGRREAGVRCHEAETTERIEVMRLSLSCPTRSPLTSCCADGAAHASPSWSTSTAAPLVTIEDLLRGDRRRITDEYDDGPRPSLGRGAVRVSSRMDIDEFNGSSASTSRTTSDGRGLMAKHLGKVPIPGAEVVCEGRISRSSRFAGAQVVSVLVNAGRQRHRGRRPG
jgi:Mg2+/Co2+ transporter CorC